MEKPGTFSVEVRKVKYGKLVTIINTNGIPEDKKEKVARTLKKRLGTGGTVKNGEIILQGDQTGRMRVIQMVIAQVLAQ